MITKIKKRDGRIDEFRISKIADAIFAAAKKVSIGEADYNKAYELAGKVVLKIDSLYKDEIPTVEQVQDIVEKILIENGHAKTSKEYILYRQERSRHRELKTNLMETINELTYSHAIDSDIKRENGNINCDSSMGTMLKFGSSTAKEFNELYVLRPEHAKAHHDGDIHIHDFDFYTLTTTCTQIPLKKLFKKGFSTGHGFLRTPNSIETYAALTCIAIQSNQNDQHGGQSIPMFDYDLSDGVKKSFVKNYIDSLSQYWALYINTSYDEALQELKKINKNINKPFTMGEYDEYLKEEYKVLRELYIKKMDETQEPLTLNIHKIQKQSLDNAIDKTDKNTYQAMEALIHNLNTMNSRAGAQVPFSSINYGTDTSLEGRMIIKNVLLALDAGLGKHETPIFPIHIFKVKDGINYKEGDPNYDLFELACKVSAKRLFPNFSFIDAPFNLQYYKPEDPNTEIAYMGCRTRVIGNIYDPSREIVTGRGNLSFTTINLPRLAIESDHDIDKFFDLLNDKLDLCIQQLLDRFEIQCQKLCLNYPFLMEQGVWIDSENLKPTDEVREVLKHGTLSVGFIGLTETLISLIGKHHAESKEAQQLGLKIVKFMRDKMDEKSDETKLNFSLLASPAESLSGRFVRIDKEKYGIIPGVTDKDYYTNSFHCPVYYKMSVFKKLDIEAPYHELTNAGHISYIELDGDPTENVEAFKKIVKYMKEVGIGYGAINHPVDTDPECGYQGIIGDTCPMCGRTESKDNKFKRIRRITGYLTTTLDRWNNAKQAEERDRVKHSYND